VRLAALPSALLCALTLAACGNTLQSRPISHSALESLIVSPHPVYWAGASFNGLAIIEATHDPGGAASLEYGNCLVGGQGVCVPPLRIITSPDNSFLPGGSTPSRPLAIRGVPAVLTQAGRTITIPTGGVVVDIYASTRRIARAAAQTIVPINEAGAPEAALPAPLPNTGFAETPLPSQVPSPLRAPAQQPSGHS